MSLIRAGICPLVQRLCKLTQLYMNFGEGVMRISDYVLIIIGS